MDEMKSALMAYGLEKLASVTGGDATELLSDSTLNWQDYEALLGSTGQQEEEVLSSIFSYIALRDEKRPALTYLAAQELALNEQTLFPVSPEEAAKRSNLGELWQGFVREYDQLRQRFGQDAEAFFEGFYHLYHKWAWAVPCTYGEPGVSLFQQWKAVVALVFASGGAAKPAKNFTLIGGDIPGIQDFVYTITSKGAAKELRGRSFFIQLLGDAVVRRILADLRLCPANVIYDAGGNFMVLGPKDDEQRLAKLRDSINDVLLEKYGGELALCLAWIGLKAEQVGTGAFSDVSAQLKQAINREKGRRFVAVATKDEDSWQRVFAPDHQHLSQRCCDVCQRAMSQGEGKEIAPGVFRCPECISFQNLAREIACGKPWLAVGRRCPDKVDSWQRVLHNVAQRWYQFGDCDDQQQRLPNDAVVYALNGPERVPGQAHGFRFLANITPVVQPGDLEKWEPEYPGEEPPKPGSSIREFSMLAEAAQGVKRLGVLRMDVDDLGQLLIHGMEEETDGEKLNRRTMAATSALSTALDRFFGGWLDEVCHHVMAKPELPGMVEHQRDLLYTIYAGGDDLFIVGAWHLLPLVANRVRQDFDRYVSKNPSIHISAGITLTGRKFPLHRAAERAREALDDEAKEHVRLVNGEEPRPSEKNALSYLGQVVGWEGFDATRDLTKLVLELLQHNLPRGLLQTLQTIYLRFSKTREQARHGKPGPWREDTVYFGPWMWQQAYAIGRLKGSYPAAKHQLNELQRALLDANQVRHLGLAARWAELLTRKEE